MACRSPAGFGGWLGQCIEALASRMAKEFVNESLRMILAQCDAGEAESCSERPQLRGRRGHRCRSQKMKGARSSSESGWSSCPLSQQIAMIYMLAKGQEEDEGLEEAGSPPLRSRQRAAPAAVCRSLDVLVESLQHIRAGNRGPLEQRRFDESAPGL